MNPSASHHPDDATLVAWLDDELPMAQAAAIAHHVAQDTGLAQRVQLLRATRAELAWALGEHADAAPPKAVRAGRWQQLGLSLLAAAALAVVVTIGYWPTGDEHLAAENDLLRVRLTAARAEWDLFTGIRFTIEGRAKTSTPCRILSRLDGESDAEMAARALAENGGQAIVPMVLDAEITGPDRRVVGEVARVNETFTEQSSSVPIELIDVRTRYDGISPLLTVRLDEDGARSDFTWGSERGVAPADEGSLGFVPEEVGAYRLLLRLRALPAGGAGEAPAFAVPLEIAMGFAIQGVVGEWSAPVDGMRARIAASSAITSPGKPLAIALQLRNDSDRPRKFNVTGSTMAKIPQPFHFDLMVDGRQCGQRDGLGVTIAERSSFLLQPVGTLRTIVALADYWLVDGRPRSELRGAHEVSVRFHFEPSLWSNDDMAMWMGRIDAPPITIDFGEAR